MRKIIAENLPIIQKKLTRKEAEELYAKEDSSRGRLQLDLENNEDINIKKTKQKMIRILVISIVFALTAIGIAYGCKYL